MYVVLGASGNTGHVVAKNLLSQGKKVRVVGRSAEHLKDLAADGAEVVACDLVDGPALAKAFKGADSAYVMIPPNLTSNDSRAFQDRISDAIAAAIENAGVKNVVSLSSIGAENRAAPVLLSGSIILKKNSTALRARTFFICAPGISWKTHYRRLR